MKDTELLKTVEVQKLLNCSRDKVLELVSNKTLTSVKLGPKTIRIHKRSVEELINNYAK